jgi:hypothetical protein
MKFLASCFRYVGRRLVWNVVRAGLRAVGVRV